MRDAFTMRFQPEIAEFIQDQARASNRSVTNFVETLLLREKLLAEERQRQITVQADPELLRESRHELLRDADETDDEFAARAETFSAILGHARQG